MKDSQALEAAHVRQSAPQMTREIYLELIEALNELDAAFKVTAESANARRWVEQCWSSAVSGEQTHGDD